MRTQTFASSLTYRLLRCRPRILGVALVLGLVVSGNLAAQSALDGFDPNANGTIRVVVVQPDGKILLGGDFTSLSPNGGTPVTRNRIARLNPDGTLDTVFNPDADETAYSIAVQADGKIVAGGFFSNIGGQVRNHIARLDAATGLADSFDPNADNIVQAVAVQLDGKILLGGSFTTLSPNGGAPVARNRIARVNPDGTLDPAFNPNANDLVYAIAIQADGKILAGGFFTGVGGQARNFLARLDATTGLADSFNPNVQTIDGHVLAIAVQADGKILAGGWFASIGGQPRNNIARLDPTTGLADSFNPNADARVLAIAVQPDGKILAGGSFHNVGGQSRDWMARLDATTGLADSFDASATGSDVRSIAVQADGKILAGGAFTSAGGQPRNRIARFETDGRLDQTLDNPGMVGSYIYVTAIQRDGKILIGGDFTAVQGVDRHNIARLNADGTLDTAFNPNADGTVRSIAFQADGRILIGGSFTNIGGQSRNRIARLDPTTGAADSFNPRANDSVLCLAVQGDGMILAGGVFNGPNSIGGQTRNGIARLDPVTGLADSFDPNANDIVFSIAVQADGKILVGGFFRGSNGIGSQARSYLARLDAVTGLADSFDPQPNSIVFAIAVQPDGKILVGGDFWVIGGAARNRIARLDPTTAQTDGFDPNANSTVYSIALQADGRILAAGYFTSIGSQNRKYIARFDAVTGLADWFNPGADQVVRSLAIQTDGKILAGGDFTNIGSQPRSLFARLSNDTAALQELTAAQSSIVWRQGGSSPQFTRVGFEYSIDNINYSPLGEGISSGANWILGGLSFPTGENFFVRARGHYTTGDFNGSESIAESVRRVFVAADGPAPSATPTATTTPTPTATATATATPTATAAATPTATAAATPTATATATPTATAAATASATATAAVTPAATPTVTPVATPTPTPGSILANISTRLRVGTGDNVLVAGFIIGGTQPKKVIIRAMGPSLAGSGIAQPLANPTLELYGSSGLIASNDDWRSDQETEIIASTIAPPDNKEAAIVATLPADNAGYTAVVRGANGGSGVGVVEVYDLDPAAESRMVNISTRGLVQTNQDVLIAGTIVMGPTPRKVIIRALGPSLPITGALADPVLELRDGNGGLLEANDDWVRSPNKQAIIDSGIPPADPHEAAIVRSLSGNNAPYTAVVYGVNETRGIALVEVYALD